MKSRKKSSKIDGTNAHNSEKYKDGMGEMKNIKESRISSKMKVRYVESKQVKDFRENYEKMEKQAMRKSRSYR